MRCSSQFQFRFWKLVLPLLALSFAPGCEEPDHAPDDPRQAVVYGWDAMSSADYERAEAAFRKAQKRAAADSEEQKQAIFGLANSFQHRKPVSDYAEAEKYYSQLLEKDAGHELGGWSALAIARMHHLKLYEPGRFSDDTAASRAFRNLLIVIVLFVLLAVGSAYALRQRSKWLGLAAVLGCAFIGTRIGKQFMVKETLQKSAAGLPTPAELDKIRADYNRVIDLFAGTNAADEAAVFIGSSYIEQIDQNSLRQGIAYLHAFIEKNPQSSHRGNAYGLITGAHEMLEEYAPMMDALMASVAIQEDPKTGDPNVDLSNDYYRIAYLAEHFLKAPQTAIEYYSKLKKKYPTDSRVFYCNRALKELGVKVDDEPADETDTKPEAPL
jgi:tetratricopeptide (TPR) repeat protein